MTHILWRASAYFYQVQALMKTNFILLLLNDQNLLDFTKLHLFFDSM